MLPPLGLRFRNICEKLLLTYSDATHSTFQLVRVLVYVGARLVRGGGGARSQARKVWLRTDVSRGVDGSPHQPNRCYRKHPLPSQKIIFGTRVVLISSCAASPNRVSDIRKFLV